jgi:predicted N-formylglutamate amidohydrolase
MKRLKMIYAVILAVIYVAATTLSSLAVLTCDHPHHTHITSEVALCLCADGHHHHHNHDHGASPALDEECCDHDHTLLGENHTQIIVEKQRGDDAMPLLYMLVTPAVIAECVAPNPYIPVRVEPYHGYEQLPLQAAFSRCDSLRAPPQLA